MRVISRISLSLTLLSLVLFSALNTSAGDKTTPKKQRPATGPKWDVSNADAAEKESVAAYHQGTPRRLRVKADDGKRSVRIDLPDLATMQKPGLVLLTRDLDDADQGFVVFNGRRIPLPPVPGGLCAKIVIPLRRDDLQAAGNAVTFGSGTGGYVILDWRIDQVHETQPTIAGQTYHRLTAGGCTETIRAFDGVMAYERKRRPLTPDAVPHWTRRGAVRMMKFDNDPLFLASCYWWYYGKHRDVMENLDTKYADRVLEICRQGHINCVMLRWSCCMSLAFEQQWQQRCTTLIERLHAQNIRVSVYQVLSGVFYDEMFLNEPASKEWVLTDDAGQSVAMGWNRRMYLTDIQKKGCRAYVLRRAELALEAGADELYYDIPCGAVCDLIDLFTEIRSIAHRKNREVSIYTNVHGALLVEDICDLTKSERFVEPCVRDGVWTHNIGQLRYNYGVGEGWKPFRAKYGIGGFNTVGTGGYFVAGGQTTVEGMTLGWTRPIAEAAMFGAHFNIAENNTLFETSLVLQDDPQVLDVWEEVGLYNAFLERNEGYYTDIGTNVAVAILAPMDWHWKRDFLDSLGEMSLQYDLLPMANLGAFDLAHYRQLILPDLPWVPESVIEKIRNFKTGGGRVYAVGCAPKIRALSDAWSEPALCHNLRAPERRAEFTSTLKRLGWAPQVFLDGAPHVVASVMRKRQGHKAIVHLLNYATPVTNLKITLDLHNFKADPRSIRLLSPDHDQLQLHDMKAQAGRIRLTIPELNTYCILVIDGSTPGSEE